MADKQVKHVYDFSEGDASMKLLLGGKGANLAQMSKLALPVPPGFILTTEVCKQYWVEGPKLLDRIWPDIEAAVGRMERATGKKFGGSDDAPLLVSVRSGAPVSMPGMMDTILNLGLNDQTVEALARASGDERFAYDSYRRFIQMFSDVVLEVPLEKFEDRLAEARKKLSVEFDYQITGEELKRLVADYKKIVSSEGKEFPTDPWVQLKLAADAVFRSWNTARAITYRKINNIPDSYGTAVNIQTMVFGNLGNDCGTGVCFTRDPATGDADLYGEFLINAQGEDVVAGIRTPAPISELGDAMPKIHKELLDIAQMLEKHYRDMQDIEFTVERGKLYILQTRNGKRTAQAAVKVAADMFEEKLINREEAISRVTAEQAEQLLHPQIDPEAKYEILAKGLNASPGAAVGEVVFDADEAEEMAQNGIPVILCRPETTPDDIHGLFAAQGVLTSHGGKTSHAAVVARGMGKPCVSGAESVLMDVKGGSFTVNGTTVKKGDYITIDGSQGWVILGKVPLIERSLTPEFQVILALADEVAEMEVWTNADTPEDAARAYDFGAKGIGLCRTEHMFMQADRLPIVQEMILACTKEERVVSLKKLEAIQTQDFLGIFKAMKGYPVTVRLLDPPLHEFLPKVSDLEGKLKSASSEEVPVIKEMIERAKSLHEANPMMGFRGCRLGIIYPEIFEMQVRAIMTACCDLANKGLAVLPEIMMPLVGTLEEMKRLRELADRVAAEVVAEKKAKVHYMVGTMIEVPRAALIAEKLAEYAEFFSFGTNDLTQMTFGYSRDDAEAHFLMQYVEKGVLPENPFNTLDRDGVGQLMSLATEKGRRARKEIRIGICGEHGGDPSSVAFCNQLGLDYVSCSPFRVPVARLSAALAKMGALK